MAKKATSEVLLPNLGVYLNVPSHMVPGRGLADCLNVRVQEGSLTNFNIGWDKFSTKWKLNGPVKLIDNFFDSTGAQKIIFASYKDLYEWIEASDTIAYLTPRYSTGTAICTGTTSVTGASGAAWQSAGIKAGDFIHFGANNQRNPTTTEQSAGPNATWYQIQAVTSETAITLTTNGPNLSDPAQYTIRKCLTANETDIWSTELFHNGLPGPVDWWIGTNGVDNVLRWNGTDTQMEYMSSFGFTCKTLIRWYNMMIYGTLNVGGLARRTSIRNSDIGSPFDVSGGVAAELISHDGVDELLTFFTLSDALVIYSVRTVTLVSFVGLPELFAFRKAISGIGPLAAGAVADFGDRHEFIASDASYAFDGVSTKEINSHVMREVIRKMAAGRQNQIISHFGEETGELYWIVPLTTDASQESPETSYSEHYLEDVPTDTPTPFTIRDLPATCTGYFESLNTLTFDEITTPWSVQGFRWDDRFFLAGFPLNLFGKLDGYVYRLNTVGSQDGSNIESFVEFGRRATVDGMRRGCVKRVYLFPQQLASSSYDLNVTVKMADQLGADDGIATTLQYDLAQAVGGKRFVNPYTIGRFFSVTIGTTGVDRGWLLMGYDAETAPLGERDV